MLQIPPKMIQIKNRIGYNLARSMERHLSSAVDGQNLYSLGLNVFGGSQKIFLIRQSSQRKDGWMFAQKKRVGGALNDFQNRFFLQIKGVDVIDQAKVFQI